jgi:uncharacterized membrane protein
MAILLHILTGLGLMVLGFIALTHSFQLTRLFGHNYYAEKYLGTGGTYGAWKLVGAILIIIGVIYLFK